MNKSVVERPRRWDEPLSADIDQAQLEFVLASKHFKAMSETNFPSTIALHDIILNDCRIRNYDNDQLIVRAGSYLNSAFILLSGSATMVLSPGLSPSVWGRKTGLKPSLKCSLINWLTKPKGVEVRDRVSAKVAQSAHEKFNDDELNKSVKFKKLSSGHDNEPVYSHDAIIIKDVDRLIKESGSQQRELSVGDMFCESAVLGRNEMHNTVVAKSSCRVLEIRWQGLRELRRREPEFKAFVDSLYRERGLFDYLLSVPLFESVPKKEIATLARKALFEIHGEFEWHASFQAASKKTDMDDSFDHLIDAEPVVAQEGSYPDGLLLVRNGFGRISRKVNHGHYTFGHLSSGEVFGLEELYDSWLSKKATALTCSFRALGYTDVIRIPSSWLEKNVFQSNNKETKKQLEQLISKRINKQIETSKDESKNAKLVDRKFTEFVVENRLINGTKTMMIDLERCVRCDDCVTACANAHDNNPRFNRHGPTFGKYMVANACMHCVDPVCMIGCPTGAIHRTEDGVVSINDATCIGCTTCANSCPYDNIRMVVARDGSNKAYVDEKNVPIMKATKCDLCSQTSGGPACERACSHDALTRIDLKDITKLADWIDR